MPPRDELASRRQLQADCVAAFTRLVTHYPDLCTPDKQARLFDYVRIQTESEESVMPRQGYQSLGEELVIVTCRLPKSVADRVMDHIATLRVSMPWAKLGPSDAMRDLTMRGLQSLEAPPSPIRRDVSPALPLGDESIERQSKVQSAPLNTPTALVTNDTPPVLESDLPPHVIGFADLKSQYKDLTLEQLAKLAFDRGIYQTKKGKPADKAAVSRWLTQGEKAGLC